MQQLVGETPEDAHGDLEVESPGVAVFDAGSGQNFSLSGTSNTASRASNPAFSEEYSASARWGGEQHNTWRHIQLSGQ